MKRKKYKHEDEESYLYYYTRNGVEFTTPSLDIAVIRSDSDTIKVETILGESREIREVKVESAELS